MLIEKKIQCANTDCNHVHIHSQRIEEVSGIWTLSLCPKCNEESFVQPDEDGIDPMDQAVWEGGNQKL